MTWNNGNRHPFYQKVIFLLTLNQFYILLWIDSKCLSFFYLMDGWVTCGFTSFSTVFQSYQDDGKLIMKDCVQWNSVFGGKDFASRGDGTRGSSSFFGLIKYYDWLVGCFGFNGPLRQYFSLYRAVSRRKGGRGEKG